MRRETCWWWALSLIWACGDKPAPAATPASSVAVTPAQQPASPTPPPAAAPSAPNPCDNPSPVTLDLAAGTSTATPWNLEFRYVIDDDKKLGPGYLFQLRSGDRRWETRRDNRNWNRLVTWRGFCWRGAERPPRRSLQLKIDVAPVCKDGKLQEFGGCGTALGAS